MPSRRSQFARRPLALLAALLAIGASALVGQPASAETRSWAPPTSGYVALGDSYAAGEGLPPFEAGTGTDCHRSASQSYPALLGASGVRQFSSETSVACSGAVTYDVVATRPGTGNPPQISALGPRTRTVTLTIGGNDSGFSLVFGDCVYSPDPSVQSVLPGGGPGCATRDDAAVSTRIAALSGAPGAPTVPGIVPLPAVLAAIGAAAPRATIYVTGYPRLFGSKNTNAYGCQVSTAAPLFVAGSDTAWIREKAGQLNKTVEAAVAKARAGGANVRYADVARTYRGHNLCDRGRPWLNGVVLASTSPLQLSPATFHPTATGQRAYARSVLETAWRFGGSARPRP